MVSIDDVYESFRGVDRVPYVRSFFSNHVRLVSMGDMVLIEVQVHSSLTKIGCQ